jgi:hypothetical protein
VLTYGVSKKEVLEYRAGVLVESRFGADAAGGESH